MPGSQLPNAARHAVFAPLDDGGVRSVAVGRRLSEAIALGLIADGEQLPAEAELATALNVSTVTLREALAALRRQGIIETRRGRGGGSFVRAPGAESTARARVRLRELGTSELRELGDHHSAVAGTAARLAAARASAEHSTRLSQIIDRLASARDVGTRRRADGRFCIEVAAASQSVRLTRQEIGIQAEIGELLWLPFGEAVDHADVVDRHRDVLAAIEAGDGERARALTERRIEQGIRRLVDFHFRLVSSAAP